MGRPKRHQNGRRSGPNGRPALRYSWLDWQDCRSLPRRAASGASSLAIRTASPSLSGPWVQKIDCHKRRPRRRLESGLVAEPARLRTFENPARFFDELEEFPPLLYLLKHE